jgi:hypothetical protein
MKSLNILLAAMMLAITAAAGYAATAATATHPSNNPKIVMPSRDFEGVISRIGGGQIVINDTSLGLQLVADVNLKSFAPGDYVSFRLNEANMVVVMFHLTRPKRIDPQRFFTPAMLAQPAARSLAGPQKQATPSAEHSGNSAKSNKAAPVQQQNGVWTN